MQALKNVDIVLATKIIQASLGDSFELSIVSDKHQLYNITDKLHNKPVFDLIIDELQEHLKALQTKTEDPFIYLFGIGNGYNIPTLLANPKHQRIIIIEPELELLFVVLHLYDFSDAISLGRLKFFHQKSLNFAQAVHIFTEHQALHFAKSFEIIQSAPYYTEHFYLEMQKSHALLIDALSFSIHHQTENFSLSLDRFEHYLKQLPFILTQNKLAALFPSNQEEHWAILVNTLPKDRELLLQIRPHVTLFASQSVLKQLHKLKITPDIVVANSFDKSCWKGISQKAQKNIKLILSADQEHPELETVHAQKMFYLPKDIGFNYLDVKDMVYLHDYEDMPTAFEIAYKMKHSHLIIMDDSIKDERSIISQEYAYLTALSKETMSSYQSSAIKLKHLNARFGSFETLSARLIKHKINKFDLNNNELLDKATLARADIKRSLLIQDGYTLLLKIQDDIANIKPWYDALEGLSEDTLLMFYSDDNISAQLQRLTQIKQSIQESPIYQRFYHDFIYPSMLLQYIEMGSIQSIYVSDALSNREKALQWSISNYHFLTQLHQSLQQSIERFLKL